MINKKERFLGVLYGAAYGDSLGAVTESCTREEIISAFPNECMQYAPSISRITKGIVPGSVTDDFGSSIYLMKAILRHNGNFNRNIAVEAIIDWSHDPVVFGKYAGNNTKASVEKLKNGIIIDEDSKSRHFAGKNTNGAAMKVSPIALLSSEIDTVIEKTLDLCWPTHYNSAAASGAAAIACAICEALQDDTDLEKIYEKAVYGAKTARNRVEKEGCISLGPYVDEKIKLAVKLGKEAKDFHDYVYTLNSLIGLGPSVQESVCAVFGIIAASKGNLKEALKYSVNAGGDTDTISSMIGAILGGYYGIDIIDKKVIRQINEANRYLNIEETIHDYADLLLEKGEIQ